MAQLIVRKEDGSILFDTSKISYGLIKSGYMSLVEDWGRYVLAQGADPTFGGNWYQDNTRTDPVYGFSVTGARSPVVFIVGKGVVAGTKIVGDTMTFLYTCADTSTKFYCFDLMVDKGTGPKLKCYNDQGVLTFNSIQTPMNVIAAVTPPDVGPSGGYGGTVLTAYAGGTNQIIRGATTERSPSFHSIVDIPVAGGGEVAAFLPWNRSFTAIQRLGIIQNVPVIYSHAEGCYGGQGKVTFMFGVAGTTTQGNDAPTVAPEVLACYRSVFNNPKPTALVVRTLGLPFPFEL